jgi:hypothetical protein
MKKLIITAAIVASIGGLAACGSHPVAAAAPAPTVTKTVVPTPTPTVIKTVIPVPTVTKTVVPVPTKTVYVAPPQAAPALTDCGNDGSAEVYAGADTSCPFALNVAGNWSAGISTWISPGVMTVNAYSPVTGLSYAMNCDGAVDVVCTGGDNALVQFSLGS